MKFRLLTLAILISCLVQPVKTHAQDAGGGLEIGGQVGFQIPDSALAGESYDDFEGVFGVRAGWVRDNHWSLAGDIQYSDIFTETFAADASQLTARASIEYLFNKQKARRWFAGAGVGSTEIHFKRAEDFTSAIVSVSAGQRWPLSHNWRMRWEARADQTLAEDGLRGDDLTTVQIMIGAQWGPLRVRRDSDGDGVRDLIDRCPNSEPSLAVNRWGCERDADDDGVADHRDACPNSESGIEVDARGCREGWDDDGVPPSNDRCPSTPSGAIVDRHGCPRDGDGDGVPDGLDRCPATLKGISVDSEGCFLDADKDGVYDGMNMDRCPGTPEGAKVDGFGCPLDTDGDGIYDGLDRCPDTPKGKKVNASGC